MSLPYYKRFPRDFLDKTIGMTLEQKGAYGIVLDLIYMRDGRLPDDVQYLAGQLGCSVRKWKTIRDGLVALGKLTIENGMISNSRADKVLEETRSFRDKQAENRSHPNKNSELPSPKIDHSESDTDTEEETEAKASVSAPTLVSLERITGTGRKPKPPIIDADLLPALEAYQKTAQRLASQRGKAVWPAVAKFTGKRQAALRARIKEHGLEAWGMVLRKAYASSFCTGLTGQWAADFDFLTSPDGFLKTLEGKYDDRSSANGSGAGNTSRNGSRPDAFDRLAERLQGGSDRPDTGADDDAGTEGGYVIDIGPARIAR